MCIAFNSHHCFCTKTGPNSKFPTNVWWWLSRHLEMMIPLLHPRHSMTVWEADASMFRLQVFLELHFQIKMCFSCLRLTGRDPFFFFSQWTFHDIHRRDARIGTAIVLVVTLWASQRPFFGKVWELAHRWYSRVLNVLLTCFNRRGRRFWGCVFPTKCGAIFEAQDA